MKKGFTLPEILMTVAIIGVLFAFGTVGYNKIMANNRIDITESDLRNFTTELKMYTVDYGKIKISSDENYDSEAQSIINTLNNFYLEDHIQLDSISDDKRSFSVKTTEKNDVWDNPFKIIFYTYDGIDADSVCGMMIVSSMGKDGLSSESRYKTGDYGDDIIAVIKPNQE